MCVWKCKSSVWSYTKIFIFGNSEKLIYFITFSSFVSLSTLVNMKEKLLMKKDQLTLLFTNLSSRCVLWIIIHRDNQNLTEQGPRKTTANQTVVCQGFHPMKLDNHDNGLSNVSKSIKFLIKYLCCTFW